MKRIIKNIVLLFGAALSLTSCAGDIVFYYEESIAITSGDRITYQKYQRLSSNTALLDDENIKYSFKTYEEAMEYKDSLKEKSEPVYSRNEPNDLIGYSYEATISFLESLRPNMFENKQLFISPSWSDASYNYDSCRLEGVYVKDDYLYIHEYCDYKNKSLGSRFWYYFSYTFFISKNINFTSVRWETTDLFKY